MAEKIDMRAEIEDLEEFFSVRQMPGGDVIMGPGATIINCSKFVASHISYVKHNPHSRSFVPYLDRLKKLRDILCQL